MIEIGPLKIEGEVSHFVVFWIALLLCITLLLIFGQ